MKQKIKKFFSKILDFLVPTNIKCVFCGDEISCPNQFNACDKCLKTLPYNQDKICKICGTKLTDQADICLSCFYSPPPFNIARAPFLYDSPIPQMIYAIKFDNAKYLIKPLANFMLQEYQKNEFNADVILPIPLSDKRLKERTYNQAELLAQELGTALSLPLDTTSIKRTKNTSRQATLSWRARQQNVVDAFEIQSKKNLKGKTVLVIDDVMTSGATIKSFCHELQKARPKQILVLTLAHTYIDRIKTKNTKLLSKIKKKIKIILKENLKKLKNKIKFK